MGLLRPPLAANVVQSVDERHHWTWFEPLLGRMHRNRPCRPQAKWMRLARQMADAHALKNAQLGGELVALADPDPRVVGDDARGSLGDAVDPVTRTANGSGGSAPRTLL